MKKLILMTSAAVIAPLNAIAQTPTCTATPDCANLGYTEASCPNGGVKCPWGDKWFCSSSEAELCSKYGFKYTCTGYGYAGGEGGACGGKYASCTCIKGHEWNGSSCAIRNACMKGSQLGYILNSDMTVTSSKQSGKTPIGVVVCSYSGGGGQAMALKSLGRLKWATERVDISGLTNYKSSPTVTGDVASCENSAIIRAQGDSSTYPAVWTAYNYTTTGTKVGDWCLPAAGIFVSIHKNQSIINAGFSSAGGAQFTINTSAWASSEYDRTYVWNSAFSRNKIYGLDSFSKGYNQEVRPVIEF